MYSVKTLLLNNPFIIISMYIDTAMSSRVSGNQANQLTGTATPCPPFDRRVLQLVKEYKVGQFFKLLLLTHVTLLHT